MKYVSLTIVLGLIASSQCGASSLFHACPGCGCRELNRVCKVVPDVKKVTETKYVVECEEVCLPGKSRCEDRLVDDPACIGSPRYDKVKVPTCDRIVTKKKLKKTTTTVEKAGWKCVIETTCSQCGNACGPASCGK